MPIIAETIRQNAAIKYLTRRRFDKNENDFAVF